VDNIHVNLGAGIFFRRTFYATRRNCGIEELGLFVCDTTIIEIADNKRIEIVDNTSWSASWWIAVFKGTLHF
jgi:hypothetical protein